MGHQLEMPMDESQIADRLDFALDAATTASAGTLELFGARHAGVELKADGSPVTRADRACEEALRTMIAGAFPDDAILGEEMPPVSGTSGVRWIIDPIDGTKSFIHGVPLYATLLAAEHDGEPILGVIVLPALQEIVYAGKGLGAWHQTGSASPSAARVSSVDRLDHACLCTTSMRYFQDEGLGSLYEQLSLRCGLLRGWSDAYAHVLVATGRADAAIEPTISLWDAAPMATIMAEAGGRYSGWSGRDGITESNGIASNGLLHDELLTMVRAHQTDQMMP